MPYSSSVGSTVVNPNRTPIHLYKIIDVGSNVILPTIDYRSRFQHQYQVVLQEIVTHLQEVRLIPDHHLREGNDGTDLESDHVKLHNAMEAQEG